MSAECHRTYYVPQWYQRQFIPVGSAVRELYLLDLNPEWFRDGNGVRRRRRRKALRRTGTRRCFAIDVYTTYLDGVGIVARNGYRRTVSYPKIEAVTDAAGDTRPPVRAARR